MVSRKNMHVILSNTFLMAGLLTKAPPIQDKIVTKGINANKLFAPIARAAVRPTKLERNTNAAISANITSFSFPQSFSVIV